MLYTLIGKKLGMTQIYEGEDTLVPVTVIEAGPCQVLQVKTLNRDGYNAVQIGYGRKKDNRLIKAEKGLYKKLKVDPAERLREVRCDEEPEYDEGQVLTVTGFDEGQKVDIVGVSKGKGFQGVVKRWGFKGGPRSHGSMFHRRGGSFGQSQWPGEVYKGRKMPGRMGHTRRTVQNLKVVRIMEEKNILLVKGSVPGANGSQVLVRTAKKSRKSG